VHLQRTVDSGSYCTDHVALLRHGINDAERLGSAGSLGLAGEHHRHCLHRTDETSEANRAAKSGMQTE